MAALGRAPRLRKILKHSGVMLSRYTQEILGLIWNLQRNALEFDHQEKTSSEQELYATVLISISSDFNQPRFL